MIIDPAQAPTSDVYRVMIRCIVPRPIAWVSTISTEGVANLAPFSFFTGVTSNPPTVCFAPGRKVQSGERKDTLRNVEETGEFVVNMVSDDLAERMNDTAIDFPPEIDEFAEAGVTAVASKVVLPPRVAESPVSFECRRYDVVNVGPDGPGGGALVIGEIVMIHIADRVLCDGKVDPELLRPLARLGGLEYAKLGERFVMKRRKYPLD
jgi:flavin reductase (DIM6/NTAB) family NADH-FMN oxidoreductase RutF